jgi:hypothetical protein
MEKEFVVARQKANYMHNYIWPQKDILSLRNQSCSTANLVSFCLAVVRVARYYLLLNSFILPFISTPILAQGGR